METGQLAIVFLILFSFLPLALCDSAEGIVTHNTFVTAYNLKSPSSYSLQILLSCRSIDFRPRSN